MSQPIELQSTDPISPTGSENILQAIGELDATHAVTELQLSSGETIRIPTTLLAQHTVQPAGTRIDASESRSPNPIADTLRNDETLVIPIIEERLVIDRRTVPTGKVRLQKSVQEFQQTLDEPLAVRTFDIERVVLNRPVETPPEIRHEGQTTIYSLVEEQLILTKQLILKEEIRVTRRDTERRDRQVVTLRREHLAVDRS